MNTLISVASGIVVILCCALVLQQQSTVAALTLDVAKLKNQDYATRKFIHAALLRFDDLDIELERYR